jgi:hypothetical protein
MTMSIRHLTQNLIPLVIIQNPTTEQRLEGKIEDGQPKDKGICYGFTTFSKPRPSTVTCVIRKKTKKQKKKKNILTNKSCKTPK